MTFPFNEKMQTKGYLNCVFALGEYDSPYLSRRFYRIVEWLVNGTG